jgi:Winged helix-turn helix
MTWPGCRVPSGLAKQARIVLLAADGVPNAQIARTVGVSRPTVIGWRDRYAAGGPANTKARRGACRTRTSTPGSTSPRSSGPPRTGPGRPARRRTARLLHELLEPTGVVLPPGLELAWASPAPKGTASCSCSRATAVSTSKRVSRHSGSPASTTTRTLSQGHGLATALHASRRLGAHLRRVPCASRPSSRPVTTASRSSAPFDRHPYPLARPGHRARPDHGAGLIHSYGLPDVVGGLASAKVSDFRR